MNLVTTCYFSAMSMFEQLKFLYDNGLFSNVSSLASLLLTTAKNKSDELNTSSKFYTYIYYADSLLNLKEYKKSESMYRKALQMLRAYGRGNGQSSQTLEEIKYETELKYKIHLCLINQNLKSSAASMLESIPTKQRKPCVNMALAKLYHESGARISAINCYKAVIRDIPLATEAAQSLLSLGVKASDVLSLMAEGPVNVGSIDWLDSWVNAHAYIYSNDFYNSLGSFEQLEKTSLRDNPDVLVSLGEAYFIAGDFQNAKHAFERAHAIDPFLVKGADCYASILSQEKRIEDLERLVSHVVKINDMVPETLIVLAYLDYSTEDSVKAANLVNKALTISPNNVEALILNGRILLEMGEPESALSNFGAVTKIAPHRYEAHKGLIESFLALKNISEAIGVAYSACKQMNSSVRAITLYASTLNKDPSSSAEVKSLLERALDESHSLDAAHLLATIHEQEHNHFKAIEVLSKIAEHHSTHTVHQKLGELLTLTNQHEKALLHFSVALKLNSDSQKSGVLIRNDQSTDSETSFDVENIADDNNQVLNLLKLI